MSRSARAWLDRLRRVGLALALLGGIGAFLWIVHQHYPIQHWMFWRYASYWLSAGYFLLACISVGHLTVKLVLGRSLPLWEHVAVGFAIGVFEFELLMFVAGVLQLYHWVLFYALPAGMIAAGGWPLWRWSRRAIRRVREARQRFRRPSLASMAIIAFGFVAFGMIYFLILTPENVQFDSRWKHIALAEQYVVSGGIRRFPEGWTIATRPNFTSYLYTWAFLAPRTMLFDRMEICAHLEFISFVMTTLFAIPAVVRRLVPRADVRLVWAARFLFPGVFLYDSSLSAGVDHFGALFGSAICLMLLRAWPELEPRRCGLLALLLAAPGILKETAALLLVPVPIVAVALRSVVLLIRRVRKRAPGASRNWWLGPLVVAATCAIFTAPHWAKNWILYGNPVYPVMSERFSTQPWTADASYVLAWLYDDARLWKPTRDLKGVLETLEVLVTFSFVPNDWPQFHGKVPVFGSLFTLLVPCLLFLKKTLRIWAVVVWIHVSVALWYWTHHQDRYLQGIVPLMAAVTAAGIVLVWRQARWVVRSALMTLVGLQIVWGGDVYFIATHAIIGSPQKKVLDLLALGHKKKYRERFRILERYRDIGRALPKNARVLLHEERGGHLGIGRETVSDTHGWQFGISYGLRDSPRGVYDLLQEMGVSHLFWANQQSSGEATVASDLLFFDFALKHAVDHRSLHGGTLARMPPHPPEESGEKFEDTVAVFPCGRTRFAEGLYRVRELQIQPYGPDRTRVPSPRFVRDGKVTPERLVDAASFALLDPSCREGLKPHLRREFTFAAKRGRVDLDIGKRYEIWVRTSARASPVVHR